MIDLNAFYKRYQKEPMLVKAELRAKAEQELANAVAAGYYSREDLAQLNYSEICDWLGWPDWQDGGLFEDAIDRARNFIVELYYNN